MASGVDELEAFIAALRLSFITSSTVAGSPEGLCQGIAAFRETLRPRGPSATSPAPTEECGEKESNINNSRSDIFAQAGEPISSTSTVWSNDDDRVDVASLLTKQIQLVNTEVREGTSQIRELIQSVKELKAEVRDLRSTLAASEPAASNEVIPSSPTPIRATVKASASSTLIREARVDSSPYRCLETASGPSVLDSWGRCLGGEPPIVSAPSPPVTAGSFTSPNPSPAAELPTIPRMPSRPPSPAPFPVAVSNPVHSQTSTPVDPIRSSGSVHPVPKCVPVIMFPSADDHQPAMSSAKPQDITSQPVSDLEDESGVAETTENKACDPGHGDNNMEVEDVNDPKVSNVAELHSESPVIATAVQYYNGPSNEGELSFSLGDKITILDSPSTPVGWMYGERTETRRGIVLARYVKEMSDPEVKRLSIAYGDYFAGNLRATEPSPGSSGTLVAIRSYGGLSSSELSLRLGDRITILDSPNTPDGWIYGEIAEKRQGIFPARFVTVNKG